MSSSSSGGGDFVAGTPAKSRLLAAQPATAGGGRFARGPTLAQPATVRAAAAAGSADEALTRPALQRVAAPPARAATAVNLAPTPQHVPLADRFSAPSVVEATSEWAGQGSSLLHRGAGGFSRIAQERQKAHELLGKPAPTYGSEPPFTAAATFVGSVHASASAPPPRAEARCAGLGCSAVCSFLLTSLRLCSSAPAAAVIEPVDAPPRAAPEKRAAAGATAAEGRPLKRARPVAAARPAAPRAGSTRDNFVRLQLGKAGRCKGAGGRKFVTGCVRSVRKKALWCGC